MRSVVRRTVGRLTGSPFLSVSGVGRSFPISADVTGDWFVIGYNVGDPRIWEIAFAGLF